MRAGLISLLSVLVVVLLVVGVSVHGQPVFVNLPGPLASLRLDPAADRFVAVTGEEMADEPAMDGDSMHVVAMEGGLEASVALGTILTSDSRSTLGSVVTVGSAQLMADGAMWVEDRSQDFLYRLTPDYSVTAAVPNCGMWQTDSSGRLVLCWAPFEDSTAWVYDDKANPVWDAGRSAVSAAALDGDGEFVIVADGSQVRAIDFRGASLWETSLPSGWLASSLSLSPHGDVVVTSEDGSLCFITGNGDLLWHQETLGVSRAILAPDGRFIAVSSDHGAKTLWLDPQSGRVTGEMPGVEPLDISPTGATLVASVLPGEECVFRVINSGGEQVTELRFPAQQSMQRRPGGLTAVGRPVGGFIAGGQAAVVGALGTPRLAILRLGEGDW